MGWKKNCTGREGISSSWGLPKTPDEEEKSIFVKNRIPWLHETDWGRGGGPRRNSGLIDSGLPTCPACPVPRGAFCETRLLPHV